MKVDNKAKKLIQDTLLALGIAPHYKGFAYLEKSLEFLMDDGSYLYALSNRLYPDVATCFKTTAGRVERAIRNARQEDVLSTTLGADLFQYIGKQKFTNSYFLGRVLLYLQDALEVPNA